MMKRIIFASKNQNKLKEVQEILGDSIKVISMEDIGLNDDIIEDGKTFEENAIIKATEISKLTGEFVLADDSGLEIDYLNGEPGVYSHRYLGDIPFEEKNIKILEKLKGIPMNERTAKFVTVLALITPDGETHVVEGGLRGHISEEPRGKFGFSYDAIFLVIGLGKTLAEMTPEEKNEVSPRKAALKEIIKIINDI